MKAICASQKQARNPRISALRGYKSRALYGQVDGGMGQCKRRCKLIIINIFLSSNKITAYINCILYKLQFYLSLKKYFAMNVFVPYTLVIK